MLCVFIFVASCTHCHKQILKVNHYLLFSLFVLLSSFQTMYFVLGGAKHHRQIVTQPQITLSRNNLSQFYAWIQHLVVVKTSWSVQLRSWLRDISISYWRAAGIQTVIMNIVHQVKRYPILDVYKYIKSGH